MVSPFQQANSHSPYVINGSPLWYLIFTCSLSDDWRTRARALPKRKRIRREDANCSLMKRKQTLWEGKQEWNGMEPGRQNIMTIIFVDFEILVTGLANFGFESWLCPRIQGKLSQSTHKQSPNLSPTPPSLTISVGPRGARPSSILLSEMKGRFMASKIRWEYREV